MTIPARLWVENHRGRRVPAVLGLGLVAGGSMVLALIGVESTDWLRWSGCVLVAAAGLVDDLASDGPRGLRGHLSALAGGRATTGAVKIVVIVAAAIVVVASSERGSAADRIASVVLIAAMANVVNGLDVRPGRALKGFLVSGVILLAIQGMALAPTTAALLPLALASVIIDLRERAMLGDAGANLLGFALGLGIWGATADQWVWLAAAAAVALNVIAETVTFSRAIAAVPPLRWLDSLGRRPDRA